jgi:hypothetical protein
MIIVDAVHGLFRRERQQRNGTANDEARADYLSK